jgi:hypothetical protein
MTQIWVGDVSLNKARRDKLLHLAGETKLKSSMSSWIGRSLLASIKPA